MTTDGDALSPMTRYLLDEYGATLSSAAVAKLLGFNNLNSLAQARRRGHVPIRMFQLRGRREWFATAADVGAWLDQLGTAPSEESLPVAIPSSQRSGVPH
jgi:hypothetical protein